VCSARYNNTFPWFTKLCAWYNSYFDVVLITNHTDYSLAIILIAWHLQTKRYIYFYFSFTILVLNLISVSFPGNISTFLNFMSAFFQFPKQFVTLISSYLSVQVASASQYSNACLCSGKMVVESCHVINTAWSVHFSVLIQHARWLLNSRLLRDL